MSEPNEVACTCPLDGTHNPECPTCIVCLFCGEAFDTTADRCLAKAHAIIEAAKALVAKLDACEPEITSAFTIAAIHGCGKRARDPEYGTALNAIRDLLAAQEKEA